MRLTDLSVKSLPQPEKGQKLYYDDALPAFGIRVSQGGTRSFFLQHGSDRRFITIGRYPIISLSDARAEAKRLLAEFTLGKIRPQSITVEQAVRLFLEEKAKNRRAITVHDYKWFLNRPNLRGQLSDITTEELQRNLQKIKSKATYNHCLIVWRILFNWAIKRRYVSDNPTLPLSTHATEDRTRLLEDREIKAIWDATHQLGYYGNLLRLLVCTGMRRGEAAALQPSRLNTKEKTLTIPANVAKNGTQRSIPLSQTSVTLATTLATNRPTTTPYNAWSKPKKKLDTLLSGIVIDNWTPHDFRRYYSSTLARQGVRQEITEKLIGHISGKLSGVAAIYNRYDFWDEQIRAVAAFDAHLRQILTPELSPSAP